MSDFAAESGHWYDPETGEPRYTVIGRNGLERPSTLTDAKKHTWRPGATTILQCEYRWALANWKEEQAIMAALTTERREGETDKELVARIKKDAAEQAKKAAERGTAIHGAIERMMSGQDVEAELAPYASAAIEAVKQHYGFGIEWSTEHSFCSPIGFGGKVDLHSADDAVVIDFKGKDGDVSDQRCWDNHAMQLAAYSTGLNLWPANCAIVFFSRTQPQAKCVPISEFDLDRGWRMFDGLLDYWYAKTGLTR